MLPPIGVVSQYSPGNDFVKFIRFLCPKARAGAVISIEVVDETKSCRQWPSMRSMIIRDAALSDSRVSCLFWTR